MNHPKSIRAEYVEDEAYFLEAYDRMPGNFRYSPASRAFTVVIAGTALLFTLYRTVKDYRAGDRLWWFAPVIIPLVFGLGWYWTMSPRAHRRNFRRGVRRHFEGKVRRGTATFDDDGFVSACDDGRSKTHLWSDVPRALLLTDGCFVFIDATTSFWFPRRAFASAAEFQGLLALLAAKVAHLERPAA